MSERNIPNDLPYKENSLAWLKNIEMRSIEKELRDTNILPMCLAITNCLGNKDRSIPSLTEYEYSRYTNKNLLIEHKFPTIIIGKNNYIYHGSEYIWVDYKGDQHFYAKHNITRSNALLPEVVLDGKVFVIEVYRSGDWEKTIKNIYENILVSDKVLDNLKNIFAGKFGKLPVDYF